MPSYDRIRSVEMLFRLFGGVFKGLIMFEFSSEVAECMKNVDCFIVNKFVDLSLISKFEIFIHLHIEVYYFSN